MKKAATICLFLLTLAASGQQTSNKLLKRLDLSATAGTTGIGIDLAANLNSSLRLRAGGSFVPYFQYVTDFKMEVGDDPALSQTRFDRLSNMLKEMTGYKVDNSVDMVGTPNFNNLKLILDVSPFKNKRFYFSMGLYAGNRTVAKAKNTTEEMPSLLTASIYNAMYDKIEKYMYEGTYGVDADGKPITSLFLGIEFSPDQYETILDYGRMAMPIGHFNEGYETDNWGDLVLDENGDPILKRYKMRPGENSLVRANIVVNKVRPYVGCGYKLDLKNNNPWSFGVDAGIMFWGGSPSVIAHDGTDLIHDISGAKDKIGRYIEIVRAFNVFPVLNLSLGYRLF